MKLTLRNVTITIAEVYVLWATAVAFAVLQFALVCSMPVRG